MIESQHQAIWQIGLIQANKCEKPEHADRRRDGSDVLEVVIGNAQAVELEDHRRPDI